MPDIDPWRSLPRRSPANAVCLDCQWVGPDRTDRLDSHTDADAHRSLTAGPSGHTVGVWGGWPR